jgi:hypothetical protein
VDEEIDGKDKIEGIEETSQDVPLDIANVSTTLGGAVIVCESDITLHLALAPGEEASLSVRVTLLPGMCT